MILTKDELLPDTLPPRIQDRLVAARTMSLFCWMAALWFFLSPWTYFGVSDQTSGWNAWVVGGLMVAASLVRVIQPKGTSGLSLFNSLLSLWVIISPFVFGYEGEKARMINTITAGIITLAFSLLSLEVSKDRTGRLATPDTYQDQSAI